MRFSYYAQALYLHIINFSYYPLNLNIQAVAKITPQTARATGEYNIEGIQGKFSLFRLKEDIHFKLNSKEFLNRHLQKLFTHIPLHPQIKAWSYQKIRAKKYKLAYCKGSFNPKQGFDPNKLEALILADKVQATFHPSLPPAKIQKVALHYKNDTLFFKLTRPTYQNIPLLAKVHIFNITQPNSFITIALKTQHPFDKKVQRLLQAFHISLPITQTKGSIDAKVTITIRFQDNKTTIKGRFHTKDAKLTVSNIPLTVHKAYLKLHNTKAVLKPSIVSLDPFIQRAKVSGTIDPKGAKLKTSIDRVAISFDTTKLFEATNLKERLFIDFATKKITLHYLPITIDISSFSIATTQLEKLTPFSPILQQIKPQSGHLFLELSPLHYKGSLHITKTIFYRSKAVTKLNFQGDNKELTINDFFRLKFHKTPQLFLSNITIDIGSLNKKSTKTPKLKVFLQDTLLRYKTYRLPIQRATINIDKKIDALFWYNQTQGRVTVLNNLFTLQAKKVSAQLIQDIFKINFIQGGRFDIEAKGAPTDFQGRVVISHTLLKELAPINNLLAFLNTLPALMTLQDPGFHTQGLPVTKGIIDFHFIQGILHIPSLHLISKALEFQGSGFIDLNQKKISMQMKLNSLKSATNILSKIPLAGYILLGEDGKISSSFSIVGDLDNPKIETHMTKDIIQAPFGIIKRALELPLKILH